jgi:hypothetical protein
MPLAIITTFCIITQTKVESYHLKIKMWYPFKFSESIPIHIEINPPFKAPETSWVWDEYHLPTMPPLRKVSLFN